jgi:lipopolysaccharide/colanic/teichoic acid biosynthesis glycosyltransferase
MSLDAEKHGAQFASANDTRVFPFGEFMRKTRIDELPQMLNVLKGEMHFVGPRPERKFWIEQFEKDIPYYNERHLVAPGITGWAQVMYPYGANVEDAKQKLMYDLYYIKHWSLWLEIKVLIKTVQVVLGKKGV